jgi:hypothetical protein
VKDVCQADHYQFVLFSMDIFLLIVTSLRIILFTSVANSVQTIF